MPKFQNQDAARPVPSFSSLWRWKVTDRIAGNIPKNPDRCEVPKVEPELSKLRAVQFPSVTWIGHATYLVQVAGRSILTDPVLEDKIALIPRNVPLGIEVSAMPKIDIVTISHNHRDHLDVSSIRRIGPDVTYVVPMGLRRFFEKLGMKNVFDCQWWQEIEVKGVHFTFVPAHHWSRRGAFDHNETLWGGWIIKGQNRTVWHAGDTAYFEGFKEIKNRIGSIDAALLPIGAYEPRWFMKNQHMNPSDAVQAFVDSGAHLFCAMHWGTFKLTDEPLDEPPKLLKTLWEEQNISQERLFLAKIGETFWL